MPDSVSSEPNPTQSAERVANTHVRLGLPRTARLRKAAEFQAALRRGKRIGRSSHFVLIHLAPAPTAELSDASCGARLGLIVGKRHARRAVDRNAVKRVWREAFRARRAGLPAGDYVVRLAAKLPELSQGLLKRQLRAEADQLLAQTNGKGRSRRSQKAAGSPRAGSRST